MGTLVQAGEGSMLAAMFSGNWDKGHKRDSQGRVFIDANPSCFDMLLTVLRLKGIDAPDRGTPVPKVAEDRKAEFEALVKYYAAPLIEHVSKCVKFKRGAKVILKNTGCNLT